MGNFGSSSSSSEREPAADNEPVADDEPSPPPSPSVAPGQPSEEDAAHRSPLPSPAFLTPNASDEQLCDAVAGGGGEDDGGDDSVPEPRISPIPDEDLAPEPPHVEELSLDDSPPPSPSSPPTQPPVPPRPYHTMTVNFSEPRTNLYVTSSSPTSPSTPPPHRSPSPGQPPRSSLSSRRNRPCHFPPPLPLPSSPLTAVPLLPSNMPHDAWLTEVLCPPYAKATLPSAKLSPLSFSSKNVAHHLLRRATCPSPSPPPPLSHPDPLFVRIPVLLPSSTKTNSPLSTLVSDLNSLRSHIAAERAEDITSSVAELLARLIDTSLSMRQQQREFSDPASSAQALARETFVQLGGADLLLSLFRPPFINTSDARDLEPGSFPLQHYQAYNDSLLLLRELSFLQPSFAANHIDQPFLTFLFTLLSHENLFDHAAGLIEEVLSLQSPAELFFIGEIPDLYSLMRGFTCRQAAYFCRVLALLVFEPEDRQAMENSQVLRSVDLLQLRRDRTSRANDTIDRNQAVLLGCEEFLPRMLDLMRILNFSPPLHALNAYHVIAHFPNVSDLLINLGLSEIEDWDDIERVLDLAGQQPYRDEDDAHAPPTQTPVIPTERARGSLVTMLERLSPQLTEGLTMAAVIAALNSAQELGVGVGGNVAGGGSFESIIYQMSVNQQRRREVETPLAAANECQFNALVLGPYQVELCFVLCTLLGGRRKIDLAAKLSELGVVDVLSSMFVRLAWGTNKSEDENRAEQGGIHGPGCECNPESALRVQFLRLLHNFCDRDCDNSFAKRAMLTKEETLTLGLVDGRRQAMLGGKPAGVVEAMSNMERHPDCPRGLLAKVVEVLIAEPADSKYKFWLASCIESYLRGATPVEQAYVASHLGLLDHLAEEILSDRIRVAGSLQTSFDLLAECTKGNAYVLTKLLRKMTEEQFSSVMLTCLTNLVDSNVFIRSLVLSLERDDYRKEQGRSAGGVQRMGADDGAGLDMGRSYLSHSWWDVVAFEGVGEEDGGGPDADLDWFLPNFVRSDDPPLPPPPSSPSSPPSSPSLATPTKPKTPALISLSPQGWVCSPGESDDSAAAVPPVPAAMARLRWFISKNQIRLLRERTVVTLASVNHENICVINTTLVILIFTARKGPGEVAAVLQQIRDQEEDLGGVAAEGGEGAAAEGAGEVEVEVEVEGRKARSKPVLQNFRELCFFWSEYYTHRGRDRLSIEFSSHVRFAEWENMVKQLCADDGRGNSLLAAKIKLPRSPYTRPPASELRPPHGSLAV